MRAALSTNDINESSVHLMYLLYPWRWPRRGRNM